MFFFQDDYSFDSDGVLTVKQGSLRYSPNRQYEIRVSVVYRQVEYYQKVRINIQNINDTPIIAIE